MENQPPLGNPIPMAVITATEILAPLQTPRDLGELAVASGTEYSDVLPSTSQLLAEVLFAPLAFWSSMTASYLRFFYFSVREQTSADHVG